MLALTATLSIGAGLYGAEERLTRLSRAVALSMVDVPAWAAAARGTFAHTLEGHVGAESLEVAVAQRQWKAIVTAKKMGHAVGSWTLAVDDAPVADFMFGVQSFIAPTRATPLRTPNDRSPAPCT